jgi:hypothetical protein
VHKVMGDHCDGYAVQRIPTTDAAFMPLHFWQSSRVTLDSLLFTASLPPYVSRRCAFAEAALPPAPCLRNPRHALLASVHVRATPRVLSVPRCC